MVRTIFGGKKFLNKLAWTWITVAYSLKWLLIHKCMAFSNVLNLEEVAFRQKRKTKYSAKCTCNTFTVLWYWNTFHATACPLNQIQFSLGFKIMHTKVIKQLGIVFTCIYFYLQEITKKTGVSWNKRFKRQYGPIAKVF